MSTTARFEAAAAWQHAVGIGAQLGRSFRAVSLPLRWMRRCTTICRDACICGLCRSHHFECGVCFPSLCRAYCVCVPCINQSISLTRPNLNQAAESNSAAKSSKLGELAARLPRVAARTPRPGDVRLAPRIAGRSFDVQRSALVKLRVTPRACSQLPCNVMSKALGILRSVSRLWLLVRFASS